MHMLMGPLGGLCLGFCVDYRYKTAMNCFGALMLGTGIYGLHGAVLLRIVDTVLGVTFALVFSAIFHINNLMDFKKVVICSTEDVLWMTTFLLLEIQIYLRIWV